MMLLNPEQVKGRIRNIAKLNHADARILMRIYMMERFLERVAVSGYRDNFVIKGGILVTAMVGVSLRSTMDIDTTITNIELSMGKAKQIVEEICEIDLGDEVRFKIDNISDIMDEMEYPGLRFTMTATMGNLITPMKIDISTGDVITPCAVEYKYKLLLEERDINLWSYNIETILAEKLQTVLSRGILNTRMRDFYDIHVLLSVRMQEIDSAVLGEAFKATCKRRGTDKLRQEKNTILASICADANLQSYWESYRRKYQYAANISYADTMRSLETLIELLT